MHPGVIGPVVIILAPVSVALSIAQIQASG
jgi:hypothetical protein